MLIRSRLTYVLSLCLLPALAGSAFGQREYPEAEKKIEKIKRSAPKREKPKGRTTAVTRTNGVLNAVLFVLTDPPASAVVVKDAKGAAIKRGLSDTEGEFRTELPPGVYDLEVSSANYKPEVKKGVAVRPPNAKVEQVDLTPTVGSIMVGPVEPEATVLIDGKRPRPTAVDKTRGGQIELKDLPEGTYKVGITQPNYVDWQGDVKVEGGARTTVFIKFKEAVANLIIKSAPGATIFVDNAVAGRTDTTGELRISKNPGRYTLRAEMDKFKPSAPKTQVFSTGDAVVELPLTNIVSAPEKLDDFTQGIVNWEAPRTWKSTVGKMAVSGPGIGFLKDAVYDNFNLEFVISFVNAKGAAWALRARDKQSYYMFQLSAPATGRPVFRSFVVEGGVPRLLKTESVVENLTTPGDSYTITIEAVGNQIKHFIRVKSTPRPDDPQPLSTLVDNSLSYGQVGFGTKDAEEFTVHFVNIGPRQ